jgi:hypothetical protein
MYPDYAAMTEGIFETIGYFSLIGKDGEALVNVLQKQDDNPTQQLHPAGQIICGITTSPPIPSTFAIQSATETTLSIGVAPWVT